MKKRMLAAVFAAVFCLQLVGCGGAKQSEPAISNDGEVFSCTNQELIDLLNAGAKQNDISTIDYDGKHGDYNISGAGLKLKLRPYKPEESPEAISLYYYPQSNSTSTDFGYYVGAILGLTDPESSDELAQSLFSIIESAPASYSVDGVKGACVSVLITSYGGGGHDITFSPMTVDSDTAEE